jgi:hypothetical protein
MSDSFELFEGELLKNSNGAKKSADILPVPQLAVTLHKN